MPLIALRLAGARLYLPAALDGETVTSRSYSIGRKGQLPPKPPGPVNGVGRQRWLTSCRISMPQRAIFPWRTPASAVGTPHLLFTLSTDMS